jgi:hypothetical protein
MLLSAKLNSPENRGQARVWINPRKLRNSFPDQLLHHPVVQAVLLDAAALDQEGILPAAFHSFRQVLGCILPEEYFGRMMIRIINHFSSPVRGYPQTTLQPRPSVAGRRSEFARIKW